MSTTNESKKPFSGLDTFVLFCTKNCPYFMCFFNPVLMTWHFSPLAVRRATISYYLKLSIMLDLQIYLCYVHIMYTHTWVIKYDKLLLVSSWSLSSSFWIFLVAVLALLASSDPVFRRRCHQSSSPSRDGFLLLEGRKSIKQDSVIFLVRFQTITALDDSYHCPGAWMVRGAK